MMEALRAPKSYGNGIKVWGGGFTLEALCQKGVVGGEKVLQQLIHHPPLQAQVVGVHLCLHRNLQQTACQSVSIGKV